MDVIKVINNNIVTSMSKDRKEVIVMGNGIGFKVRPGSPIDDSKVEKVFQISNQNKSKFEKMIEQIPMKHIMVASEIISYAKCSLGKELSDNIYISLADHISFAIERQQKGMEFHNALLWEIQRFYNHEFEIGQHAIKHIKTRLKVELPEDEAGFIALHIVNAELSSDMQSTVNMTKMIQAILNIVKYHFHMELDESSLDYERFITHLKFFAQRLIGGKTHRMEDDGFCEIIKNQYSQEYKCAEKIGKYVEKEYGHQLSAEEKSYLTVHIHRIVG